MPITNSVTVEIRHADSFEHKSVDGMEQKAAEMTCLVCYSVKYPTVAMSFMARDFSRTFIRHDRTTKITAQDDLPSWESHFQKSSLSWAVAVSSLFVYHKACDGCRLKKTDRKVTKCLLFGMHDRHVP